MSSVPPQHPYEAVVKSLRDVFDALQECGLGDVLSKGGVGTLLLAHHLDHLILPGDKGADAEDAQGQSFEYKVSSTNQFNFNFGGRPPQGDVNVGVRSHFSGISGAYCGLRKGPDFTKIVYVPTADLIKDLVAYFPSSKSMTLIKNYSIEQFAGLPNAINVL